MNYLVDLTACILLGIGLTKVFDWIKHAWNREHDRTDYDRVERESWRIDQ